MVRGSKEWYDSMSTQIDRSVDELMVVAESAGNHYAFIVKTRKKWHVDCCNLFMFASRSRKDRMDHMNGLFTIINQINLAMVKNKKKFIDDELDKSMKATLPHARMDVLRTGNGDDVIILSGSNHPWDTSKLPVSKHSKGEMFDIREYGPSAIERIKPQA